MTIQGYQRKPTQFDWCGTKVWLRKITKAERESVFGGDNEGLFVDLVMLSLTDDQGNQQFKDRADSLAYFEKEVAEDDCVALAKMCLKHSGLEGDTQKKS